VGPLEILFSWQALLVVSGAVGLTQLVKTVYDVRMGQASPIDTPTLRTAAKVGKALRKGNVWMDRFVLPMCPIVFGACLAMLIPARPDPVVDYVKAHEIGKSSMLIYAAWGAVCGQFADYLFAKVKTALKGFLPGGGDSGAAAP
jgi:hypothetical protein